MSCLSINMPKNNKLPERFLERCQEIFGRHYFDKIKFVVSFTNHTLTLNKFNATTARVLIQSDPMTAYLERGVLKEFDINNDSVMDIKLRYDGLDGIKARMFIQDIHQILENRTSEIEVSLFKTQYPLLEDNPFGFLP